MFGGVPDELLAAGKVQFAQDVAHVVLHRLLRYEELGTDLAVTVPSGDELQHLALAVRQGCAPELARARRRNSPRTKAASAGENTTSPCAARSKARRSSGPGVDLTRYPTAPAATTSSSRPPRKPGRPTPLGAPGKGGARRCHGRWQPARWRRPSPATRVRQDERRQRRGGNGGSLHAPRKGKRGGGENVQREGAHRVQPSNPSGAYPKTPSVAYRKTRSSRRALGGEVLTLLCG